MCIHRYLNMVLERKEHYFDALRDYFSFLVDHAAGEDRTTQTVPWVSLTPSVLPRRLATCRS